MNRCFKILHLVSAKEAQIRTSNLTGSHRVPDRVANPQTSMLWLAWDSALDSNKRHAYVHEALRSRCTTHPDMQVILSDDFLVVSDEVMDQLRKSSSTNNMLEPQSAK